MCDETTPETHDRALAARGLTRREFSALGAAAALTACASTGSQRPGEGELIERTARITTADGIADAFFVHPAKGKWPGVIMWPDIAGVREAKRIMARRLDRAGHAVLVVNQYYRSQPAPVMESFSEFMDPEGRKRAMALYATVTPEMVMRDTEALVASEAGRARAARPRSTSSSTGGGAKDPDTQALERALADSIGLRVTIDGTGPSGRIVIDYATLDQLDMVAQRLSGGRF